MQVQEQQADVDIATANISIKKSENDKEGADELELKIFRTEKVFEQLRGRWNRLVHEADAPIYVTREWLSCWWEHFGRHPKRRPFIVGLFRGEQLVALAPLFMSESSIGPVCFQRRLHMMGCGVGTHEFLGFLDEYGRSDFLDFIVDPDYEIEAAHHFLEFLLYGDHTVDTLALQHLRDSGFIKQELIPLLKDSEVDYELEQTDICPYIKLDNPDNFEEYLDELSSNTRRRLRQTLRAIDDEKDGYSIQNVDSSETLYEELRKLRIMHQERWNGFGYPGAFFDRRFVHFLHDFVEKGYENGWVWFKQAIDKGGHAATRLSLKFNGTFYDYMSGFDADCPSSKYRPGIGLQTLMIKESIEEDKADQIELLRGDESYKYDFTSEAKKNWRLSLPLRYRKNPIRAGIGEVLNTAARLYLIFKREWTLMKVQQELKGTTMMVINYVKTRYSMLKYKYQQS